MSKIHSSELTLHGQNGFTLIELMIALLIGVFLVGGLLTLVQDNRRVFGDQRQLTQLQDSERLALTMMTDVIQTTGYFPDPTSNSAQSTMLAATATATTPAMAAGQAMTGLDNGGAAPGDSVTVRYATSSGDGILNCAGRSNSSGGIFTYVNVFSVAVNAAGVSQLICTQNGTVYPLVDGVQNLRIFYGVNTTGSGSNVDSYQTAAQVAAAANWNNVISVQVALTFVNPLYSAAEPQRQPQTVLLQRNIAVMNQTGL
jgi:type IV pilus assembly protein PilW